MRKDKLISEVLGEGGGITPSDLYNTDFRTVFLGGYDKNEVDAFLERVGDQFEMMIREKRNLVAQVEETRERLETFEQTEVALRDALTSAQKYSETLAESARREADALLEEARLSKIRAELEAAELPEALRDEIEALKMTRNRLREDLMAIIETHGALAENIPSAEDVHRERLRNRGWPIDLEDIDEPQEAAAEIEDEDNEPDAGLSEHPTPIAIERLD
jgi:cell division initiation protein